MTARRFVVSGRVQGVGFRYFVLREAQSLALSGWVRNLPTGEVEVLAVGDEVSLGTFEGRLWQGPPHARVTAVEVLEGEPLASEGFRVLPTPW